MVEVNIKNLSKLDGIIERNIECCNLVKRADVQYIRSMIVVYISNGNGRLWTDDLEDPHSFLFVTTGKKPFLNEMTGFINSLYVDKDYRSNDKVKEMLDVARMWSKAQGCSRLQVSSWLFGGCEDITSLWESNGFEKQELTLTTII